jgi:hypothetical protein
MRAFGADVYIRVDPTNNAVLKALIVGPPDTPYELGLFEFGASARVRSNLHPQPSNADMCGFCAVVRRRTH